MKSVLQSGMDRPRPAPRHPVWRQWRRRLLTVAALFGIVFAVGSLPIIFVYFAGLKDTAVGGEEPRNGERRAGPERLKPEAVAAFVGVNIIPMDRERILVDQTVIVRDGRITTIGPVNEVNVPKEALRIEGRGQYLIPGLADMHVHLRGSKETMLSMLDLFAANGVTTVLNLFGKPVHLEMRAQVARGELRAPTIYTSGPFISDANEEPPTPEEAEQAVIEQKRAGYDLIKIHGDFSREAYRRLFITARREGMRVVGHAPRNLGVMPMMEEKQDAVAHAEEYLYSYFFFNRRSAWRDLSVEARQKLMKEQEKRISSLAAGTAHAGTWLIPTLTVFKGIGQQVKNIDAVLARPEVKLVPYEIRSDWVPDRNTYVRRFPGEDSVIYFETQYQLLEKLVKGFREAGVRMLAGTDTPVPSVVPGYSLHDELQDLVHASLTPYEALRTATANPAEFLNASDEFGTIATGKRADLLLISDNPLVDITATRRRIGVMLHGQWLPEDELNKAEKQ